MDLIDVDAPLTDAERAGLAAMKVEPERVLSLRRAWARESLPEPAWSALLNGALHLADFESKRRGNDLAPAGRFALLQEVEESALRLRAALERLDADALSFDDQLWRLEAPAAERAQELSARLVQAQRSACLAAAAARATREKLLDRGLNPRGRTHVVSAYAGHLAVLAYQLIAFGVAVSSAGALRRLSDAVFFAAGVHSTADGPLRYMVRHKMLRSPNRESSDPIEGQMIP